MKNKAPIRYSAGIPLEYEQITRSVEIILEIAAGPSHSGPRYNSFN